MSEHDSAFFLTRLPWRTGRHQGRAVYAQYGNEPTRTDVLIGLMDTPELAAEVVLAHNALLARPGDRAGQVPGDQFTDGIEPA